MTPESPDGGLDETSDDTPGQRPPLPPASFEFLVFSLSAQAEMQMGLVQFDPADLAPGEEQPQPDLELARHSIDMLGMLYEKTRGNLNVEEKLLLENALSELRFRFVQAAQNSPDQSQQPLIVPAASRIILP